jgi:putative spermidine/putrescine transport system substrate-binding protein
LREEKVAKLLQQSQGPKTLKKIDRRSLLKGAAGAGVALAAGPLLTTVGRAQASATIRYADDGGYNYDRRFEAYLKPFMEKTGVEIQHYVGDKSLAKMKAMTQVGNLEFDMGNELGTVSAAADKAGYLAPLDKSRLDMSRHMFPEWVFNGSIAWQYYTGGIGYNQKALQGKPLPKTWAEYFDFKAFPGRRGMLSRPQETLEQALMADGVKPSELYPLDLDRAYKSLDRVKNDVKIWINDTGKTIELLQTNEIDYTYTTSARVVAAAKAGVPLGMLSEMPLNPPQNVHIMKGGKNYDACMELAKWFTQNTEAGIRYFTVQIGYGPTDKPTLEGLPQDIKAQLPSRDNPQAVWLNVDWWSQNLEAVTQRHKLWLLT